MKRFLKQAAILIAIVIVVAIIQHHLPTALPTPPAQDIHGQQVQIAIDNTFAPSQEESWQLIRLPNKHYQVLVRNKGRIQGKFNATTLETKDTSGETYHAAGTVEFGKTPYVAHAIHVNPSGQSGYIIFEKTNPVQSNASNP